MVDRPWPLGQAFEAMCADLHRSTVPTVCLGSDAPCGARRVSSAAFAREFVACSRPAIIKGMLAEWPAMQKWQRSDYLFASTASVTVALTPNGRADCITDATFVNGGATQRETLFVSACDVQMRVCDFRWRLHEALRARGPRQAKPFVVDTADHSARYVPPVPYIQLQNNSMPLEFAHLLGDITDSVSCFGSDIFGVPPEATNMWIGSSLSVSSMHQDWYENLYGVVRGTKRFTLVAPWEAPRLPKVRARSASFAYTLQEEKWRLSQSLNFPAAESSVLDDAGGPPPGWVDWIAVDLVDTPPLQWPVCTTNVRSVTVDVGPGDVLYLPAMWYHRVAQTESDDEGCVAAVNYWFDMNFEHPLADIQAMLRKAAFSV